MANKPLSQLKGACSCQSVPLGLLPPAMRSFQMSDLEDFEDGPPIRTAKEVRRLSDHELADCIGEQQFLLDLCANNNQPSDPVTQELNANLDRLDAELDRRLRVGTFNFDEVCSDEAVKSSSILPSSARQSKRPRFPDVYLNYGMLVCVATGAILGYFLSPVSGIAGAFVGLLLGICLPGALAIVAAAVYFFLSSLIRLVRFW